jgi:hypothetical protein
MGYFTLLKTIIIVLVLFWSVFPQKTYAYLDPGTGSYLIQVLIAGLLGVLFSIKMYWSRIKSIFTKLFSTHKDE